MINLAKILPILLITIPIGGVSAGHVQTTVTFTCYPYPLVQKILLKELTTKQTYVSEDRGDLIEVWTSEIKDTWAIILRHTLPHDEGCLLDRGDGVIEAEQMLKGTL